MGSQQSSPTNLTDCSPKDGDVRNTIGGDNASGDESGCDVTLTEPVTGKALVSTEKRQYGWWFPSPYFTGWRVGATAAALISLVSLSANIAAMAWTARYASHVDGLVEVFRSNCQKVEQVNKVLHFCINVLGTLLLGGSNYCMQCLVAPTREVLDTLHHQGKEVDIGIPSLRYWRQLSRLQRTLWSLLVVTSVPIHLIYNSIFYSSVSTYSYDIRVISAGVVEDLRSGNLSLTSEWAQSISSWSKLSNEACLNAYAVDVVKDRSNLLIVTSNTTTSFTNGSLAYDEYPLDRYVDPGNNVYFPYSWICTDPDFLEKYGQRLVVFGDDSSERTPSENTSARMTPRWDCFEAISHIKKKPDAWAPYGYPSEYCLSQPVTGACSLNANIAVINTIICCNAIKCFVMMYVAFLRTEKQPLMVLGDAIQSFLSVRDATTIKGYVMTKKRSARIALNLPSVDSAVDESLSSTGLSDTKLAKITLNKPAALLYASASLSRWLFTIAVFVLSVVVATILLICGVELKHFSNGPYQVPDVISLGIGTVNMRTIITGDLWAPSAFSSSLNNKVIMSSVVANTPQIIASLLYLNFNRMLSSMCLTIEWTSFSVQRKMLRVSTPTTAMQRSNYFLTIPYRYAIPSLLSFALMHWLISQTLFLVVLKELASDELGIEPTKVIITCDWSPVGVIWVICLACFMLIGLVAVGFSKVVARVPCAATNSLVISAACHPGDTEELVALKPILWGNVSGMFNEDGTSHMAFSSESAVAQLNKDKKLHSLYSIRGGRNKLPLIRTAF